VEKKMQQDIKNQILNILEWTRASGIEMSKSIKSEIEQFLGNKGIPMRGPALTALFDSLSPKMSQLLLQNYKVATEPTHLWLGARIDSLSNNRVALVIEPKHHLIDKSWHSTVFVATSQELVKILLERICPPGPLEIRMNKMDLQIFFHCQDPLFARLEIEPIESESFLCDLILHRQTKLQAVVNIQNHQDRFVAQVELDIEIEWSPLIRASH
jgi:hypothetical protein